MEQTRTTRWRQALVADYQERGRTWIYSDKSLRILIGLLGLLLPLLLWFFLYLHSGKNGPLPSISHYYFTRSNPIFVAVVSSLAIFLLVYRGYNPLDTIITSAAGTFALALLLYPTGNLCSDACRMTCCSPDYAITRVEADAAREWLHYISAALFLLCLAIMSIFLFTRERFVQSRTRRIQWRVGIFYACGFLMVVSLLVIYPGSQYIPAAFYDGNHLTFWMETAAVEFFGISWLVKSKLLLSR